MDQPLVSVCLITYNHENYIRQAIDGILMQEVDFPWEIIIADDASFDQTQNIIREYHQKYPDLIKPNLKKKNVGAGLNFVELINSAKGKFVAYLEGDDYWTDPFKLQKQVDFLESNEGYSFVFTPAEVIYNENISGMKKIRNKYDNFNSDNFKFQNVLKLGGGFYPTVTALFDSNILDLENDFLRLHSTGDYPLAILAALRGKIGYIDEVTAVYRVQTNSVSNKLYDNCNECSSDAKSKFIKNINFFKFLFNEIEVDFKLQRELLSKESYTLLSKYLDCGDYSRSFKLFFSSKLIFKHLIRIISKFIYCLIFRRKPIRIKAS